MRFLGTSEVQPYSVNVLNLQSALNRFSSMLGVRNISEDGYAGPETLLRTLQVVPLLGDAQYLNAATGLVAGCTYDGGDWICSGPPPDFRGLVDLAALFAGAMQVWADDNNVYELTPKMNQGMMDSYKIQLWNTGISTAGIDGTEWTSYVVAGLAVVALFGGIYLYKNRDR